MTQDLFIASTLTFEKTASEVALPEDPNAWPNEILQELFKQVPYISDFEPHVVMDRVDAERGFAFGHIEVMNKTEIQRGMDPQAMASAGIKQARIPIIVRDRKLQPFDVLVTENAKVIPLTEARLRSAVFRPSAFDVTSLTPGDTSMIGQLYPPFRQGGGFGGGGAAMGGMGGGGKTASAKTAFAVTEKGHKFDAEHHRMKARHGAELLGHTQAYAPGYGDGRKGPNMLEALRFGMTGEDALAMDPRHHEYAAKEHEKGNNAWNPFGGILTPSSHEGPSGTGLFYGEHKAPKEHKKEKKASLLATILPTIEADTYASFFAKIGSEELQSALVANAEATAGPLGLLSKYEPMSQEKMAAAIYGSVPCSVVQLTKLAQGYQALAANHSFWAPTHHVYSRGEAVRAYGEKIVLAADTNGTVTMAEGAGAPEEAAPEEKALVSQFGQYRVCTEAGEELTGLVFPELIDVDGHTLPMMLFTNGDAAALQGEISGTPAPGEEVTLAEGHPRGYGFFTDGHGKATIPLDIKATLDAGEGFALVGETFDGRQVHVMVQPNIQEVAGEGDHMLVPDTMQWVSLDQENAVKLVSDPANEEKTAHPGRVFSTVVLRSAGEDSYSLSGYPLEKLASNDKEFLSFDQTVFLLAGLGVAPAKAMEKMAEAWGHSTPVDIRAGRQIKLASEQIGTYEKKASALRSLVHELRVDLLKEAAVIPDPVAVDTVLSLGFINPENLGTFIGYLPLIDEAQSRMCELLVASRLGMRDVPVSALEKAVRATEDVLEGLKVLAFQKN